VSESISQLGCQSSGKTFFVVYTYIYILDISWCMLRV